MGLSSGRKKLLFISFAFAVFLSACSNQPSENVQQIAVKALRSGVLFNDYKIYSVGLDGNINSKVPRGLGDQPEWSPDGQWIVFSTLYPRSLFKDVNDSEIFLLPANGGEPIQVTETQFSGRFPTWTHDGRRIAYQDGAGIGRIYMLNVECITHGADTGKCRPEPKFLTNGLEPDWSPTNSQVVYTTIEGRIFIMDADQGGQAKEITPANEKRCHHPKWSPDGTRIVLGCLGRIYILASDGRVETLFPEDMVRGAYPDWSWNGDKILFVSDRAEDLNQPMNAEGNITSDALFSINLDGTNLMRLTQRSDEHILWFTPVPAD